MTAALMLVVSIAALGQFAILYLRAVLISVAEQPLSGWVNSASGIAPGFMQSREFDKLLVLSKMCPGLKAGDRRVNLVGIYYSLVAAIQHLTSKSLPACARWAETEMTTCTRFVAVVLDQRLAATQSVAAEIRSY
jgi:hypothetical protein